MPITPQLSSEVFDALATHTPVVALESTIFSLLGLPAPHNAQAIERCEAAIRSVGAVPAITAVIDGVAKVGLEPDEHERILAGTRKVAERDLAVAIGQRWANGMTTVSASVALCHAAGVRVFATGGIGGVHRGAELTGDISADLDAIAHHPVITVSAGAKAFLDLPRTLEYLETVGVPVVGWRTDDFPAFYTRSSGLKVPHRADDADEVARIFVARSRPDTGILLANPIPPGAEIPADELDDVLARAEFDAAAAGIKGNAVTPFILGRIAQATAGRSIPANLALAESNALVAALVATSLAAGV
jgi:pseudouridine-5'-phosphate glycosidase